MKNSTFDADYVSFSIPQNVSDKEDSACLMYKPIDPKGACVAENFDTNFTMACSNHIFSDDIPYKFSLTEQLDMPSCHNDPNWGLKVSKYLSTFT